MTPDHYEEYEEQYDDIRRQRAFYDDGSPADIPNGLTFAWDFAPVPSDKRW